MASRLMKRGLELRRRVLGDAYVDDALRRRDALTEPFQDLVSEYCWGAVWSRDGLPLRERSLVTIALLAALGKPRELETHLLGAVRNGCTTDEIREALLHVAVYAGIPAALEAFNVARQALGQPVDATEPLSERP